MKKVVLACTMAFLMASCGNRGADKVNVSEVALAAPPAEPMMADAKAGATADNGSGQAAPVAATDKKIVKEGEISLETNNLKASRKALTDTLAKIGGYVDEESESNNADEQRKLYIFKVRVPVQRFDGFLSSVSAAADHVESKNIRIRDVTTEYIDITTRLNNKKLLENRYKELLAKAGKVSDILEVENKLNEIRTDIEATQGQLNYLNKQIAYSTLQITFFTENGIGKNEGNGFGYRLKSAFGDSWELIESLFFGIITLWPVIALIVAAYFIFRAWKRKRANRQVKI